jgi:hypothetical protein
VAWCNTPTRHAIAPPANFPLSSLLLSPLIWTLFADYACSIVSGCSTEVKCFLMFSSSRSTLVFLLANRVPLSVTTDCVRRVTPYFYLSDKTREYSKYSRNRRYVSHNPNNNMHMYNISIVAADTT